MNRAYKEVARSALMHNGIEYAKGDTVREVVMLRDSDVKMLKENPQLTNCEYISLEKKEKPQSKNMAMMSAKELAAIAAEKNIPLKGDEKKLEILKLIKDQEANEES